MEITIEQNRCDGPKFWFQYLASITGILNLVSSGMHYGWPSPALPKLLSNTSSIQITNEEGSWIAVISLLACPIGSLIVGTTVDLFGRKKTIILTSVPFFVAWIMIAFSKSALTLYVARFFVGIADGIIFTAVPMYIGEISNAKIRGMLGSSVCAAWMFGTLLENIIGVYLSITTAALLSSVIPVIAMISFMAMPESPYYFLMKENQIQARASLRKLKGTTDVEKELERLDNAIKTQTYNKGKFLDLFTNKSNRKAMLIMIILRGVQQFCGAATITFYAQQIFIEIESNISSELSVIIYFTVQFAISLFSSSIVDKTGRRPLLIISVLGSCIALYVEGTYFYLKTQSGLNTSAFSFVSLATLIGYVVLFSLGMLTIPILLVSELFPANVKASAIALSDVFYNIIAAAAAKCFQVIKDTLGIYVAFYAFATVSFVGFILIVIFVPETKGKTLEDIQVQFN